MRVGRACDCRRVVREASSQQVLDDERGDVCSDVIAHDGEVWSVRTF